MYCLSTQDMTSLLEKPCQSALKKLAQSMAMNLKAKGFEVPYDLFSNWSGTDEDRLDLVVAFYVTEPVTQIELLMTAELSVDKSSSSSLVRLVLQAYRDEEPLLCTDGARPRKWDVTDNVKHSFLECTLSDIADAKSVFSRRFAEQASEHFAR